LKNKNNKRKMKKHEKEPTKLLLALKVVQWRKLLQQKEEDKFAQEKINWASSMIVSSSHSN
jgi:hypothetical protein